MTKLCIIDGCKKPAPNGALCGMHQSRRRRNGSALAGRRFDGEAMAWLDAHVDFEGGDCLIWPFVRNKYGYGRCWTGKEELAHRVMCRKRRGPPPTEKHNAAHECGNGKGGCINPNHLNWKTSKENHADKGRHGTLPLGELNRRSRLTAADVLVIRSMVRVKQRVIAAKFGVSLGAIANIQKNRTWKHLLVG